MPVDMRDDAPAAAPMNAPLQVYFIRHGETQWSLAGRHTGLTELPLTAHGESMARGLATTLRGIAFSLVLTSPRLRARSTCALSGVGDGEVRTDEDLVEWDYGDYEGLCTADIQQRRPGWDIWLDGCPGGDAPADVGARADRLIERLRHLSGKVVLFSHGQFGRVLAARWVGLPVVEGRHFTLAPASISILDFEAGHPTRPVIALWNATGRDGVRTG